MHARWTCPSFMAAAIASLFLSLQTNSRLVHARLSVYLCKTAALFCISRGPSCGRATT